MKTVLITGASGGIGTATAKVFYENGYKVIIHYNRSGDEAKKLSEELGNSQIVQADVSDKISVEKMFEQIGDVDVLVNNAGTALPQKLIADVTEEEYDMVMNTNVKGTYLCCQQALKNMIKKHSGAIINVSSIWGIAGGSCEVVYSASKAAIIGFTKALSREVGPSNIRVNAVAPGVILTKMNAHLDGDTMKDLAGESSLMRNGTPEDIANMIYFLASDKADFITGQVICADGGFIN